MGHLKLQCQGVRDTSKGGTVLHDDDDTPRGTAQLGCRQNVAVGSAPLKGIMGMDQTGHLPIASQQGLKCIFVLCNVDTGCMCRVPVKSWKPKGLIEACNEAHTELVKRGLKPVAHRINNETSNALIDAIEEKQLDHEHLPKANHEQNPAKRAIQAPKSQITSIVDGVNKEFPLDAQNSLMPQTNVTLNLLQTCPVNPSHSACSCIHGPHNFSAPQHHQAVGQCHMNKLSRKEEPEERGGTEARWHAVLVPNLKHTEFGTSMTQSQKECTMTTQQNSILMLQHQHHQPVNTQANCWTASRSCWRHRQCLTCAWTPAPDACK